MTLKDILEDYGIDFATLKFKLRTDLELDNLTNKIEKDIRKAVDIFTDEIIVDGSYICDFQVYGDEPNGYIELYWGDDLVNAAEARCAQMDW